MPLIFLLACCLSSFQALAQEQVYLGLQVGKVIQFHEFSPAGPGIMEKRHLSRFNAQVTADFRLVGRSAYLHLGFTRMSHVVHSQVPSLGLGDFAVHITRSHSLQAAIKYRFPLGRSGFSLVPLAGLELALVQGQRDGKFQVANSFPQEGTVVRATYIWPFTRKFVPFPMAGLSLQYEFDFGLVVSSKVSHAQGLFEVAQGQLEARRAGQETFAASFSSRLSRLPVQFGVAYPVSRIWKNDPNTR